MALLVYNRSGVDVTLSGVGVVVPASIAPPFPGTAVNVTAELTGLSDQDYDDLELQRAAASLEYVWVGLPEYATPGLTVGNAYAAAEGNFALIDATRIYHEPVIAPSRATTKPNAGPVVDSFGSLIALVFDNMPDDAAYRIIKIPSSYVSDPSFHVHWTKSGDGDEFEKNVKWRITYTVFNGFSEDGTAAEVVLEVEDSYPDAITGSARTVHRTPDIPATGIIAGYYMSIKIQAITPVGTPMTSDPALVAMDFVYRQTINLGN